ncbi:MAG: di-heme oxidoredictase family protein [Planctomycetota bacterium]
MLLAVASASAVYAGSVTPTQPAIGEPIPGLTKMEQDMFDKGKIQFERVLTVADGLGPIFNRESCVACHINPTGGSGTQTVIRFGADDGMTFDNLFFEGGPVLQLSASNIDCQETIPASANVFTERITPSGIGGGLIESIDDADLSVLEDPTDADMNGVSGRTNIVTPFENPVPRVGRFGWKSGFATLNSFSADAARNESGITNIFIPLENDPNGFDPPSLGAPDDCDTVMDPEDEFDADGFYYFERGAQFLRFTAAPPQTPKSGMTGETIFNTIGCNECHTSSFVTSTDPSISESLRGIAIRPYSNFLLHDMGDSGDPMVEPGAERGEVRTPALWGLRVRDQLWHDGRISGSTFEEKADLAILEHGAANSEGAASAAAYTALTQMEKDQVIAFLGSLGQREFDSDSSGTVELNDYMDFRACQGGGPYTADDPCAIHDIDQDGDVDPDDFASFLTVYSGDLVDCNSNALPDLADIVAGTSADANGNAIPDECDCAADCTPDNGDGTFGNGVVNIDDVLAVINAFGSADSRCDVAPQFIDGTFGNGIVNIDDVLAVINNFGPCSP